MKLENDWKIAVIGGGGRIGGATVFELLNRNNIRGGQIILYGRSLDKIQNNLGIAERICPFGERSFELKSSIILEEALASADVVFYTATANLDEFGGYRAMGIAQGAHIMHVAEKMQVLCPCAWLLVSANPPDIPLIAVNKRFNMKKLIGLCNAPLFNKRILEAYLDCCGEELQLLDIGVNHEVWFYDIKLKGKSIYDYLRCQLIKDYDHNKINSDFLTEFPEQKIGFINNIDILKLTGYLSSPVGGPGRFTGMPVSANEINQLMKRPTAQDFIDCLKEGKRKEEVFSVTRRCAAGIPMYIADVIESILLDDCRQHTIQVLNEDLFPCYPESAMMQMTCSIGAEGIKKPQIGSIPEYIKAVLSSRILQNELTGRALAEQDEKLMLQSMLIFPERVPLNEAIRITAEKCSVEPYISLN